MQRRQLKLEQPSAKLQMIKINKNFAFKEIALFILLIIYNFE